MELTCFKDINQLKELDYSSIKPFLLMAQEREIFCERIIRIVPNKRIVVKGLYEGKKVIIKIFLTPSASSHLRQEVGNYMTLEAKSFQLPVLYFAGELNISGVYGAIFSELYPVQRLQNILLEENMEIAQYWLQQVQKTIVQLHCHGLAQKDMHPDNFLIVSDSIFLVDFSSIVSIDKNQFLENIALFYAQLPLYYNKIIPLLFAEYCAERKDIFNESDQPKLLKLVDEMRWKRSQHLMRKCVRSSSDFLLGETKDVIFVCQRKLANDNLLNLLNNPEKFLDLPDLEWIKKGNTCSVFKVKVDDLSLVVKRYNIKSKRHFLTHFLKKSRAKKSWQYANLFDLFFIPTAKPVAFVEKYQKKLRTHSYYISEFITSDVLFDVLLRSPEPAVIENTINIINQLKHLKISHGDMKATNFIVKNENVFLIDFDGMQIHKKEKTWMEARKKDLNRFRKNWLEIPRLMKKFDGLLMSKKTTEKL